MSGRPSKKARRLSTDSEGDDDGPDWSGLNPKGPAARKGRTEKASPRNEPTRSRRTTAENVSKATVSRGPATGVSRTPTTMRLTVKTSSSKLREAIGAPTPPSVTAKDPFIGGKIIEGKRARNVKKSYALPSDSDEEEDEEDEEMEDPDEDAEGEEDDEMDDGLGDEDAEGEIDEMEVDTPIPPPVIKITKSQGGKAILTAKPAGRVKLTVEQKEMQNESDEDEELSELDSDLADEVEEEEGMQMGDEEDAEGEEVEEEIEEGEEDDGFDSDEETPIGGSRASTPDLNKLTKRQRARFEDGDGALLALPDEVQVKKHLTAEEHAMRRAEMARRRKNLSEKRNEEEKMETINKLLKKQAPKTNARRKELNGPQAGDATPDVEGQKPNPLFVRWVSNKNGNRIGVPEEWLDGPIGDVFANSVKAPGAGMGGKLIQEVS